MEQINLDLINDFFGRKRYVWAKPDTPNQSANFYGDKRICRLSKTDICNCIDCARDWCNGIDNSGYTENELTEIILNDMQHYKPE